jgi:hypothetical protein
MGQCKGQRAIEKNFHMHNLPRTILPGNAISSEDAARTWFIRATNRLFYSHV